MAEVLSITFCYATTNLAQNTGVLERTHATIKTSLKVSSGEFHKQLYNHIPLANLKYKTTYQTSVGCKPTRKFHRRVPSNVLDHKLELKLKPGLVPTTDFAPTIFFAGHKFSPTEPKNVNAVKHQILKKSRQKNKHLAIVRKRLLLHFTI